ncbi:MAG: hypothetical protein QOJ59_207 [Thermomicrobiales bacterium]|nr:hypothetical protein [Thermomicrobiales bacterium]
MSPPAADRHHAVVDVSVSRFGCASDERLRSVEVCRLVSMSPDKTAKTAYAFLDSWRGDAGEAEAELVCAGTVGIEMVTSNVCDAGSGGGLEEVTSVEPGV